MSRVNLLGLDLAALTAYTESLGEKPFRARQLARWIHQRGASDFDAMSDIAKSLRAKLAELHKVDELKEKIDKLAALRHWPALL